MGTKPSFNKEISNLLHATEGNPIDTCMQCGTCSGTCPAVDFMEYSPREIIAMIRGGLKERVLSSNTIWYCASCYQCSVRCPRGICIAEMMYGLKRYSLWRNQHKRGLIGPGFSSRFARIILRTGRSFEPGLAPSYIFRCGLRAFVDEVIMGMALVRKGRMPLIPKKIRRLSSFRRMLGRILPLRGLT